MEVHQPIIHRGWLQENPFVLFPLPGFAYVFYRSKKKIVAVNKVEVTLVRIICLFLLWDLSTMNPLRISVIKNGVCFADCYGALADICRQ